MYHRLFVPIDGSPTSVKGLDHAIALAADQRATLHVFHVVDFHWLAYADAAPIAIEDTTQSFIREQGRKLLEDASRRAREASVTVTSAMTDAFTGSVASYLLDEIRKVKPDLVVMGTHGRRGIKRLFLGSDASAVASLSDVPVLLVRGSDEPAPT